MSKKILILTLTVMISTILSIGEACSDTIRVPEEASTIQDGILIASDGDTVLVADGTYSGEGNTNLMFYGTRVVLMSENGPDYTVISCEQNARGLIFDNGENTDTKVDGFTVEGGYSDGDGGGIYCNGASPTISNCLITGNQAEGNGGGVYCYNASPIMTECVIDSNSSLYNGGGISCYHSTLLIVECEIHGNHTDTNGGAISVSSSSPIIMKCIMTGNTCDNRGGSIYVINSSPIISNCKISENSSISPYSGAGGAIYGSSSSMLLTNCILDSNSSGNSSGAIETINTSTMMINCNILNNSADTASGGIFGDDSSSMFISNSIIRGNTLTGGIPNQIYFFEGAPFITYSNIEGGWLGEGNMDDDPLFETYYSFEFALHPGSPCIDSGNPEMNDTIYDASPFIPDYYHDGIRSDIGAYGGPGNIYWFRNF